MHFSDDDGNTIHRRDFRLRTLLANNPILWEEIPVEDLGDNNYRLAMEMREDGVGYRGFFIDVRSMKCL